jgi:hypothetical protein
MKYRALASILGAAFLAPTPSVADEIPGTRHNVLGWDLAAYDRKGGPFSHCVMSASYRSGITMHFKVFGDYTWQVGWSHQDWNLTENQKVSIALYVDGVGPHHLTAVAIQRTYAVAALPSKGGVFDLMRKGYRMTVYAQGNQYAFNLDGTYAALTELVKCVSQHVEPPQPKVAAPPMIGVTPPKPQPSAVVSAEERLEATKVVANILAQGEMSGFRILSAKEIEELGTDYFSTSDVVWRAEGIIGTLRILPKSARSSPSELFAAVLSDDARSCKGEFASGSLKDEKNENVLRMFTACKDASGTFEFRYTLVPVANHGHYLFATAARSDRDGAKGKATAAEASLRQAVFEVLKQ